MRLPAFGIATVGGDDTSTRSTALAATIGAFDVPLNDANPWTTARGDGIAGTRVTFHFQPGEFNGYSAKWIIGHWLSQPWRNANPKHPLSRTRFAFDTYKELVEITRGASGIVSEYKGGEGKLTNDTRFAACLIALGHPCLGYVVKDGIFLWAFPEAAASDMALYLDPALCEKLPTESISYIRAALTNHIVCVDICKHIQFARVSHRNRSAMVPNGASEKLLELIERKLYRR